MKETKSIQQILDQAKEELKEELRNHPAIKFGTEAIVLQAIRSGTKGYQGENLIEWFDRAFASTLQSFIEAEIARLEGMKKEQGTQIVVSDGVTPIDIYNLGIQDQILHLKELLVTKR